MHEQDAHFESDEIFGSSFSHYNIDTEKFDVYQPVASFSKGEGGVPLGWNPATREVYIDSSDSHSLIVGATGSKKSRMFAMPTVKILGRAGESMIISDPKAEVYARTAQELEDNGYEVSVLNLRTPSKSDAWNPLAIPYRFYLDGEIDKACAFVNDIAVNLMLSEISEKDPYWDYCASDMFFGLALLLFKYCKDHKKSFETVNIANLLRLRRVMFRKHMNSYETEKTDHWHYAQKDEIIHASLIGTVGAPDRTQSSILSTFDYKMRIFVIQPDLTELLSSNDISFKNLDEKKTALFLVVPDEKTSYHKLISLFVKQSYEYLIFKAQSKPESSMKIRLNYVLDEFSSLPAIKDFPAMITAARSRNIRFNLIVQSKHQLIQRYREETDTIQSNCSNMLFITSRELRLLNELSLLCGTRYLNDYRDEPLVNVAELQRFDKEKGEVLTICGRLYPYKTTLPDIEEYDKGKFEVRPYPTLRQSRAATLMEFPIAEEFDI